LTDFCVEHVLELVWGDEEAHGVCVWFGCEAGGSASRRIIAHSCTTLAEESHLSWGVITPAFLCLMRLMPWEGSPP
jgi:hypothetical protein